MLALLIFFVFLTLVFGGVARAFWALVLIGITYEYLKH